MEGDAMEGGEEKVEQLEVVDIVKYKILFSLRPEPVGATVPAVTVDWGIQALDGRGDSAMMDSSTSHEIMWECDLDDETPEMPALSSPPSSEQVLAW